MSTHGNGDVVVVTGANEGIGHHMLRSLRERGYRTAGLDVDVSNLEPLAAEHPDRLAVHECDVTVDGDVEAAVEGVLERWDRIDVFVNNAAVFEFGLFADRSLAATRREFEVNYFGYLRGIRAVLPHMRERDSGIVHNVGSGVALTGHPGLSGYASTKGAIEALVKSIRLELQHESVACTLMYPPATRTRSAATLDYPAYATSEPEDVGRKLAGKIQATGPVIYADWKTRLGLAVLKRIPALARRGTERFLDPDWEPVDQGTDE